MKQLGTTVASAILWLSATTAQAALLDFDPTVACGGLACSNFAAIDQGYGDGAGVDVQWAGTTGPAEYWSTGYTGLTDVVYAGGGSGSGPLLIDMVATSGSTITLNSFDIGDYLNLNRNTSWSIIDLGGGTLASSGIISMAGAVVNVAGSWTSTAGIRISLGPDAWDVGIDNVDFTVSGAQVPEPSVIALFGLGLFGFLAVRRRKV